MSLDDYSLDEYHDPEEGAEEVLRRLAPQGKRLANLLVDKVVTVIIQYAALFSFVAFITFSAEMDDSKEDDMIFLLFMPFMILIYLAPVIYYILMEHFLGKTLGKYLTNTRVIGKFGQKPSLAQIIGRSFSRFIPFEAFSFLGGNGYGWHDSLTNTRVIED